MIKFKTLVSVVIMGTAYLGNATAMQTETRPPEQEKEGTSAENKANAHKMMLLNEHMKNMGAEQRDVKNTIGQKLHGLTKTFKCPTREQIVAHAKKGSTFEIDGIKYYLINNSHASNYQHVAVMFDDGEVIAVICGDVSKAYYAFPDYGYGNKITFDNMSTLKEGTNLVDLNTEFTIHYKK